MIDFFHDDPLDVAFEMEMLDILLEDETSDRPEYVGGEIADPLLKKMDLYGILYDETVVEELLDAGFTLEELAWMDEEDIREKLREMDLDPDDYDIF